VVLRKLGELVNPKPYCEQEAAVDALAGREACEHGLWPHQGAVCPACAAKEIGDIFNKLFDVKVA
jgi:hypothetical protein